MSLAEKQAYLLAALFEWPAGIALESAIKNVAAHALYSGARGIKVYQSNGHAVAERALRAAYPVVCELLGEESFADLARALWHAHPPTRGDIGRWGDALAGFLAASAQLAEEPYLADVARCEWALHCCATQAHVPQDPASLQLLTTQDPADLSLVLEPGCTTVESAWPVVSILAAHREGIPTFTQLAEQLRLSVRESAVIWRDGLRPKVRLALPGEVVLLRALQEKLSLAQALDCAPALSFAEWFPLAFESGLVAGAQFLRKSTQA